MCHYITAVLPMAAAHGELDVIARKHGRQFQPLSNPSIEAQIGQSERYFMTTLGHCDCGTPLGALAHEKTTRSPDWSAQEQRLLRKGWSKAKVARTLAQKQENLGAAADSVAETNLKATSLWINFISEVLDSWKTPQLGLLLHMYSGSVEDRINLKGREVVHIAGLTGEMLGNMKEDVLYVFRR